MTTVREEEYLKDSDAFNPFSVVAKVLNNGVFDDNSIAVAMEEVKSSKNHAQTEAIAAIHEHRDVIESYLSTFDKTEVALGLVESGFVKLNENLVSVSRSIEASGSSLQEQASKRKDLLKELENHKNIESIHCLFIELETYVRERNYTKIFQVLDKLKSRIESRGNISIDMAQIVKDRFDSLSRAIEVICREDVLKILQEDYLRKTLSKGIYRCLKSLELISIVEEMLLENTKKEIDGHRTKFILTLGESETKNNSPSQPIQYIEVPGFKQSSSRLLLQNMMQHLDIGSISHISLFAEAFEAFQMSCLAVIKKYQVLGKTFQISDQAYLLSIVRITELELTGLLDTVLSKAKQSDKIDNVHEGFEEFFTNFETSLVVGIFHGQIIATCTKIEDMTAIKMVQLLEFLKTFLKTNFSKSLNRRMKKFISKSSSYIGTNLLKIIHFSIEKFLVPLPALFRIGSSELDILLEHNFSNTVADSVYVPGYFVEILEFIALHSFVNKLVRAEVSLSYEYFVSQYVNEMTKYVETIKASFTLNHFEIESISRVYQEIPFLDSSQHKAVALSSLRSFLKEERNAELMLRDSLLGINGSSVVFSSSQFKQIEDSEIGRIGACASISFFFKSVMEKEANKYNLKGSDKESKITI